MQSPCKISACKFRKSELYLPHPVPARGAYRHRHDTWGAGLRWTRRPTRRMGQSVRSSRVVLTPRILASSSREVSFSGMTVTTSPPHREEHEVSRKAIAQGMSECLRFTCMLVCNFFCASRHTGPRVQRAPGTPAPSPWRGANEIASPGRKRAAGMLVHAAVPSAVELRVECMRTGSGSQAA